MAIFSESRGMRRRTHSPFPWPILLIVFVLLSIGLLFVFSTSRSSEIHARAFSRQLQALAAGIPLLLVAALVPYRLVLQSVPLIVIGTVLVLVGLLLFGTPINFAKRWISFGILTVQPSEFAKIAVILLLATFLAYRESIETFFGLIRALLIPVPFMALIALQPDLGTSMIFIPVTLAMVFVAGARLRHLVILLLIGALGASAFYVSPLMRDYQRERVKAFTYSIPELTRESQQRKAEGDTEEAKRLRDLIADLKNGSGYQKYHAMICVGSGGFSGHGLAEGRHHRMRYLPESHCDFIFAVVAEEWGFLGSATVIVLMLILGWTLLSIAYQCRDPAGRLIVTGIVCLLFIQGAINIAMSLGLLPITGLPLPFISAGGSSLWSVMLALGLAINVSRRPDTLDLFRGR